MNRVKTLGIGVIGAVIVSAGALSVVYADTTNGTLNKAGLIPRSIVRQERGLAASQVLGTSETNVIQAHKNHTLKSLVQSSGLSEQSFRQKLRSQLVSDLESKGYSEKKIKHTLRVMHRVKAAKNSAKT